MPRAMAPEVTTTVSSPDSCRAATWSQSAPSTSACTSPRSSATMLEPSLTTKRGHLVALEPEASFQAPSSFWSWKMRGACTPLMSSTRAHGGVARRRRWSRRRQQLQGSPVGSSICCSQIRFTRRRGAGGLLLELLGQSSPQSLSPSRSLVASAKSRTVCSGSSASSPPPPQATGRARERPALEKGREAPADFYQRTGIELEHDPGDLHVVSRLEARGLERLDHAEGAQALLDVAHRLIVVDVVARDEAIEPPALDPKGARTGLLHPEPSPSPGR